MHVKISTIVRFYKINEQTEFVSAELSIKILAQLSMKRRFINWGLVSLFNDNII